MKKNIVFTFALTVLSTLTFSITFGRLQLQIPVAGLYSAGGAQTHFLLVES